MSYANVLDLQDWPVAGDEVLFHSLSGWVALAVHTVHRDGSLTLARPDGVAAENRKHGPHVGGWLLYGESP
jgi:hypothetical protein